MRIKNPLNFNSVTPEETAILAERGVERPVMLPTDTVMHAIHARVLNCQWMFELLGIRSPDGKVRVADLATFMTVGKFLLTSADVEQAPNAIVTELESCLAKDVELTGMTRGERVLAGEVITGHVAAVTSLEAIIAHRESNLTPEERRSSIQ